MKKLVSRLILSFAAATLLGCGAEHVTALDEYWVQVSVGEPIPDDPWGSCDLGWTCSNPAGRCVGWLEPGACEDEGCEPQQLLIVCVQDCNDASDCLRPRSGDAAVSCVDGLCYLGCDAGTTCPSGYDCVERAPLGGADEMSLSVCTQVYTRADAD